MRSVRVKMTRAEREANRQDYVCIDLRVNDEEMPDSRVTFVGWMTLDDDQYPFREVKDGEIDFGSALDHSDRWGETNIRAKRMVSGEYVTFWVDGGERTYRIAKVE